MQSIDLQSRIDAAAEKGGGVVVVERGEWVSKPFVLRSNVTLALAEGAVVCASTNLADYAHMPRGNRYFVYAEGATNVAIVGKGVLDGQGWAFRESRRLPGESQPQDLPVMMRFSRCRDLRLEGFTYRNCGAWGCHLRNCDGVVARRLKCFSHSNRTNDGIDIESSNVLVEGCDIDSGDDAVVFKTESDKSFPVTNVVVRDCRIASRCNGVKFGTGSYCDVRDVLVENCTLHRPWANPRASSRTIFPGVTNAVAGLAGLAVEVVDGGRLENVTFRNLKVEGFMVPFFVRLGRRRAPAGGRETYLRNVLFENIKAVADSRIGSSVTGVPGLRPSGIVFRNVEVLSPGGGTAADAARRVPEMERSYPECTMFHSGFPDNLVHSELSLPAWGFYVRHADDVRFEGCRLSTAAPDARRPHVAEDVSRACGARDLKLMSFNVCHCEGMDGKIDIERTAERIRAEDPDFACLQEIDWRTARSGGVDQPAELARLTGLHATFARAIFYAGGQYGVMILSRERPANVYRVPLPGKERRVLLLCEFGDCAVGTTHLSVSAESERTESIALIREAVAPIAARKPVFLTGDWNSTPDSSVLKGLGDFVKVVSDTNCQTFHGGKVSGPGGQPRDMSRFCIDYVACDAAHAGAFKVAEARVVEDRATSDHAPIVVTLEAPDREMPVPALLPRPVKMSVGTGFCRIKRGSVSDDVFAMRVVDPSVAREGYRLDVDESGVSVSAADDGGFYHALQTLRQLASFSHGRLAFPCCSIDDSPRFGWRGVHLDDSRHFFGKEAVKRTLDLMAQYKLNVFHWHLTDNTGWRLPVARYPKLTVEGATRRYSTNQKNLADRFGDGVYGPFAYTREDIKEVLAFARERHIRVVPEVDVPGHCRSLLKAYPEYGCFADHPEQAPKGAVDNVICLGDDRALKMVFEVFDELASLFPDELVHVGGDEVNKVNYRACPKCQARMKALGLKTENDLQAWFACELGRHLAKRGKRVLGWDELVLDGRPPENMVAMSWRGAEGGRAAAAAGLEAVMCPHFYCYFDYTQCLAEDPAVYPWFTERLPLEKAYSYDPLDGIPPAQHRFILGGQCCNWSEYTCNETELQWKMWPRSLATAEVFWLGDRRPSHGDFLRRAAEHRRRLIGQKVNCAPLE